MMILLYGTMGEIGPAALSGLRKAGIPAVLADFPQNLFRDEPGYRRELRATLNRLNGTVDTIIPIGHPLALSRMKAELAERGICAVVEREELITLLDSKVRFSSLMDSLGIPQPRRYSSPEEVSEPSAVVFKRDISFGGHGVHQPRSIGSLLNLIAHQSPGEPFLIEDFISGEDYSVDALRLPGYFRASVYQSLSNRGKGPSVERSIVSFSKLEDYARQILEYLDYNGVCGFDFRVDASGNAYILEANPRFTAGLETQIASGFNIPEILARAIG